MIRTAVDDGIGRITLDRPEHRNALTPEMATDLAAAVNELSRKASCLLLKGAGPVFCAGFDLECCRKSPDGAALRMLLGALHRAIGSLLESPAPVVVACQGGAIAGACALLAGADYVVADRGARLGYPVTLLGISPAVSAPSLGQRIGTGPARARLLDPGLILAEQALRSGLVSEVVSDADAVRPAAEAAAARLAAKPAGALRSTREWIGRLSGRAIGEEGLEVSLSLAGNQESRELLEGYLASLAQRPRTS